MQPPSPFDEFIGNVLREIINPAITLIGLAAFVIFVWGIVEFVQNAADAEKRKTGQQHMIWGIIGLVIVFGAGAIVNIMKATVGAP